MDWSALEVSLLLAALTTALLLTLGLWLARWLAITPWRGRPLVEALLLLPLLLPRRQRQSHRDQAALVHHGGMSQPFASDPGLRWHP